MVAFWAISRWTPKGTLLAVSAALYFASWAIDTGRVRELVLLTGLMRLLGFVGGILGLIDLCRKRRQPPIVAEVVETEPIDSSSKLP